MKRIITLILLIIPIITTAQSDWLASIDNQERKLFVEERLESRVDRALKAYQNGLNHQLPAIVESAMFNLLVLKLDYPETNIKPMLEELDRLKIEGKTSVIRYKAHIAYEFLQDPTLFLDLDAMEFNLYMDVEKADHFFIALSNVLESQIKTYN